MSDIYNRGVFLVNAEFAFSPYIGINDAWLYIQGAEIPAINGDTKECRIKIKADEKGVGESIALAMKKSGRFSAEFFEGSPWKFLHKYDLKCEFVDCLSMKRDWANRSEIATIDVVLKISR
jgi:hypothetical protein